jgi:Protein of unknown function (DUF1091)
MTNITTETTPDWCNITVDLRDIENDQMLSIYVYFLKRLQNNIMVKFKLLKIEGKAMKKIFQPPKFNYCDMRRHDSFVPVFTDLLKIIEANGNLIFKCPAEPGLYAIRDLQVNKYPIMSVIASGNYLIVAELLDENQKPKSVLITRLKVYLRR